MTDDDLRQLLTRLDAAHAATTGDQWQYVLGHHDGEDIHFVGFRRNPENQWWDRDSTIMTAEEATWVAAAHNAYPALAAALRRLLAEKVRWEHVRCLAPDAARCAREWDADHQRAAVEFVGLDPDEFGYGCDTILHVAEALAAARAQRDQARAEVERLREALRAQTAPDAHQRTCNHCTPAWGCAEYDRLKAAAERLRKEALDE